jgi:Tfp pilus assembly protein PilN
MIKVNLLKDKTVPTRSITIKPKTSALGWMVLAVMILVVGGLWATHYLLKHEVDSMSENRDRLSLENKRLQELQKQIDKYDQVKRERQSRIDIIEQLKTNQTGPVLLMNHVVGSIPASAALWLTSLDQKGEQLRITGFTVRGETIPDFMSNLSATGFFKSVDLELFEDQQKDAAKFTLVCATSQRKRAE